VSSSLRHTLLPLRHATIVSRNEPEINPICLRRKHSPSPIQVLHSIWSPEHVNTRHTKTDAKVSHTVQHICDLLWIGNGAGFSARTLFFLHKLFTFAVYFMHLSITQDMQPQMFDQWWTGRNSRGSGNVLTEMLSWSFPEGTCVAYRNVERPDQIRTTHLFNTSLEFQPLPRQPIQSQVSIPYSPNIKAS
jgi:hypothetical protein